MVVGTVMFMGMAVVQQTLPFRLQDVLDRFMSASSSDTEPTVVAAMSRTLRIVLIGGATLLYGTDDRKEASKAWLEAPTHTVSWDTKLTAVGSGASG